MMINGRKYPFWSQFIERKVEYIGGVLHDIECDAVTEIVDITLTPNGTDSAFFSVCGKDFDCGFDCKFGGMSSGERGWLTFSGYADHAWRIKPLFYRCADE